jgi:multiple sugar transport system permease protein
MTSGRIARGVGVAAWVVVFSAPLVLLVVGSLGTAGKTPPGGLVDLLPRQPSFTNYASATDVVPLVHQLANSLLVVGIAVPITVLVASSAGFAVYAAGPRLRRALIGLTLLVALVPPMALWVPRVVLLRWVGLGGETVAVAATALAATSPLFVLLYALAFLRLPRSTVDAARSEGLSTVRVWWNVAMPQVLGTTSAVAALAFAAHWGNVIEPLLLLTDPEKQTAALGIRALGTLEPTLYPVFLAGAVLVTVPPVLAFLLVQRRMFSVLGAENSREVRP